LWEIKNDKNMLGAIPNPKKTLEIERPKFNQ
jgi:hypothetical protein